MRALMLCLATLALAAPASDVVAQAKDGPQCLQHGDRTARLTRKYDSFRPDSSGAKQARTKGKFSPRYPVDVDSIVKVRGERRASGKGDWIEAERWCGFLKGKLVGTDLIVKNEKVRLLPEKKPTQSAMASPQQ